jgi:Uma2 family endonuclease
MTEPAEAHLISGEELSTHISSERYELIDGKLVLMSPVGDQHGGIELTVGAYLRQFVRAHNLGKVRVGEVGIYIRRDPDTIRAADVLFVSNDRYAQKSSAAYLDVAPDLVVEIMSPSDGWSDVQQKLRDYFGIGVRLIWVVDPTTRSVHAHRSLTDVRIFNEPDDLPGDDVLPGFSVNVAALFED